MENLSNNIIMISKYEISGCIVVNILRFEPSRFKSGSYKTYIVVGIKVLILYKTFLTIISWVYSQNTYICLYYDGLRLRICTFTVKIKCQNIYISVWTKNFPKLKLCTYSYIQETTSTVEKVVREPRQINTKNIIIL
jgi:hypothetical protein